MIRLLMELGMERSAIYTDEMQNCSLATVTGAVMAGILFYAAGTVQGGTALGSLQTAGIAAAVFVPMARELRGYAAVGGEWLLVAFIFCGTYCAAHKWVCNKIFEEGKHE